MNAHGRRVARRKAWAKVVAHARAYCVERGLDPDTWEHVLIDYGPVLDALRVHGRNRVKHKNPARK